jgi:hypothetical protein
MKNADERYFSMQAAADEQNSMSYLIGYCIRENPLHRVIIQRNLRRRLLELISDALNDLDKMSK